MRKKDEEEIREKKKEGEWVKGRKRKLMGSKEGRIVEGRRKEGGEMEGGGRELAIHKGLPPSPQPSRRVGGTGARKEDIGE